MAHNAQISALVEQLIKSTIRTLSDAEVEQCKHSVLNTLVEAKSSRVNQFHVRDRLDGLVEKARILNNDPLADAMHHRLAELSTRSTRWTPEVLSLLLDLSDRPVHDTKLEDLVLLEPPSSPSALTWSAILADDPLDDQDDIWNNVDFAADGSDEEEVLEANGSDVAEPISDPNWLDIDSAEARLEDLIQPQDDGALREIMDAQFWKQQAVTSTMDQLGQDKAPMITLTELQAVRETTLMLLDLPTSIYTVNDRGDVLISPIIGIRHVSQGSITDLLQGFAEIGGKLRKVRSWSRRKTAIPLEQKFQAAIESRLLKVDHGLNKIQARFLQPQHQPNPSLLQLHDEVCSITRYMQQVYNITVKLESGSSAKLSFDILEHLFDKICANQSMGDEGGYEYMAKLFFECFQVYLRPIRRWMETGLLSNQDQVMFVGKSQEDVPLDSLWRDQYYLIQDANAKLHAPKFLHVTAHKIFNTGKSVIFLRNLGYEEGRSGEEYFDANAMTYESVCQLADFGMVSPFTELFDMAFDAWITGRHRSASLMLHTKLESECGLQRSLDALEHIYFFRNGALSTDVAFKLFEQINHGELEWSDSFVLTELFHKTFGATACIDLECLEVRSVTDTTSRDRLRVKRSMDTLEDLQITYLLPWPIANIIPAKSLKVYARIFVFLLQIHRAKYLLQMQRLPRSASPTVDRHILHLYSLHHRLLWFTDVILSYVTDMVLSASTIDMRMNMRRAEDVDAMIAVHEAYVSLLQDRCFLTQENAPIHQAIISLLDLTVLFSDVHSLYVSRTEEARGASTALNMTRTAERQSVDSDSDEDEGNNELDNTSEHSHFKPELANTGRLVSMSDTFGKLHGYISAAVHGMSKANSVPCWEMLSRSLAVGGRD
ncbi:hypothetical protein JMJ35_006920 [Cladonia borealis]|uniref:Spindle pole body component n=1 Tax=Cladonia borealis TaxID=184061 RepID=A0AA39QZC2_9LECA|nr:hypothetical protein JMJ35_006920 [Cladonia borealis]